MTFLQQPDTLRRPFPIAANFTLGPTVLVTFSENLVPGTLWHGNWFVRWNNLHVRITHADSVGLPASPVVRLVKGLTGLAAGPNVVSYSPPPFDVQSFATGLRAHRFSDFPLNP